jgi:hypothetical protein
MQKEVQRGRFELAQGRIEGAKSLITRKVPEEKRKQQKGKKKKRQKVREGKIDDEGEKGGDPDQGTRNMRREIETDQ